MIQKVMFSEIMLVKHKTEIEKFYIEYNIPRNVDFGSLGAFLEYLISDQIKRINETIPNLPTEKAEQKVFQVSPTKYIGALGGWLKTLQIHELDATEQVPLTKVDLEMVFLELLYARKYNYITKEDQDLFFITCLYQKCLSTLYRESKQLYLDQSKQDYYLSMKAKETRINEQEANLLRKQQEWQITYKRQQKEVEGLTRVLREANARIRQLEQQIENMDDYTEEVYALRNFVYREENADNNAPSLKTMNEYICSRKIIIIGGSLNWQQKLKEVLPTIEFFEVDEKNRDISKINRVDAVFINTTIFAHSFYKKIMKELNKKEAPLFYLSGQNNIEKTTIEIYKWLTE